MSKSQIIRIVGCQGSIQFITAVSVILHHASGALKQEASGYKNYLVVYELAAPTGQDLDFFRFIKKMAELGPLKFEKIIYINPETLDILHLTFNEQGLYAASNGLKSAMGMPEADEIFLCSNWQRGNKFLMNCYPSAIKVCYGDSIGLHIPEGYFDQRSMISPIRKMKLYRSLRSTLEATRIYLQNLKRNPRMRILRDEKFDIGFYLTTNLTKGKPDWNYQRSEKSSLLKTFKAYADIFEINLLHDPILKKESIAVLITTNFSESEKMTLENEIQAYQHFLQSHAREGSYLIVKPHPRDSVAKLNLLTEKLAVSYNVKVLDGIDDYFMPFEFILIGLKELFPEKLNKIQYLTFSSVCLSIKLLFDQHPKIGLGPELVNAYFKPASKAARIQHEQDLKNLLANML